MKKIIAILLSIAITALCVGSCGNNSCFADDPFGDPFRTNIIIDYPPTTSDPTIVEYSYLTFEEMCESATDIVVAKLKSADSYGNKHAKFTFQISETIFGNASGEIEVYVPNTPC